MKVTVVKLSKNDDTFKTDLSSINTMPIIPQVGTNLVLLNSEVENQGIITSEIIDVYENEGAYFVYTLNSIYVITKIERGGDD